MFDPPFKVMSHRPHQVRTILAVLRAIFDVFKICIGIRLRQTLAAILNNLIGVFKEMFSESLL